MNSYKELQDIAKKIRQLIILMLLRAGSGHPAGSLGLADLFAYLYFKYLDISPKDPKNPNRDLLFLSNGHTCPVLYASLALKGFFSPKTLTDLRKLDSPLEGHPVFGLLPGVENTSGPLGQGLSQAIGSALVHPKKVVCILSDGELQEGQTWEALMFAGNHKLSNLTIIIDRNNIQISNFTENIQPLEPLKSKLESFNLVTYEIDGNDFSQIEEVLKKREIIDKTVVIIANTIAGKGVSFMEGNFEWHGKPLDKEDAKEALAELKT